MAKRWRCECGGTKKKINESPIYYMANCPDSTVIKLTVVCVKCGRRCK